MATTTATRKPARVSYLERYRHLVSVQLPYIRAYQRGDLTAILAPYTRH